MQAGQYPIPYIITRFSSFCKGLRKYLAVSTHICQIEGDDAATQASSTKRKIRRWREHYEETCDSQKFRVQPFLKGWREWKGQSPFPGAYLPYFRS